MTSWGTVTALQKLPGLGSEPVELKVSLGPMPTPAAETLTEGIRTLYQMCCFYDVVLVAAGMRFPAHQAVLGAMSPQLLERLRQATAAKAEALEGSLPVTTDGSLGCPELHLPGIRHPEAVSSLLDFVYGLGRGYVAGSDAVNEDVLRLSSELGLSGLQELAAARLVRDLDTTNVVSRLALCAECGLPGLQEAMLERLCADREALLDLCSRDEVLAQPAILQQLLIRAASAHAGRAVSSWPTKAGRFEDKSGKLAVAGGA